MATQEFIALLDMFDAYLSHDDEVQRSLLVQAALSDTEVHQVANRLGMGAAVLVAAMELDVRHVMHVEALEAAGLLRPVRGSGLLPSEKRPDLMGARDAQHVLSIEAKGTCSGVRSYHRKRLRDAKKQAAAVVFDTGRPRTQLNVACLLRLGEGPAVIEAEDPPREDGGESRYGRALNWIRELLRLRNRFEVDQTGLIDAYYAFPRMLLQGARDTERIGAHIYVPLGNGWQFGVLDRLAEYLLRHFDDAAMSLNLSDAREIFARDVTRILDDANPDEPELAAGLPSGLALFRGRSS